MKKRLLTGLFALSLVFALLLAVSSGPLALAAEPEAVEEEFAGYLVTLQAPNADQAALMSLEDTPIVPLDEENRIYKAGELADIRDLVYSGAVRTVEPDYKAELFDAVVDPDDPYYTSTIQNQQTGYQYNLFRIRAQAAWDVGLSGQGVTVAIIDSGLNTEHIDAPVRIAPGRFYFYLEETNGKYIFTDSSGQERRYGYYSISTVTDTNSQAHGTMSAGIIAANTNNGQGIAGIAPGVTILPIKCFAAPGEKVYHTGEKKYASALGGYTSNLISGLNYARQQGADIINMSWGIAKESNALKTAIDAASNAGCILIAAVGNDRNATLRYPAAYDNVIGVGATGKNDQVCAFSQRNNTVAVCAPGEEIFSLYNENKSNLGRGSGTSFSTPMVAAVAALLKEANPAMTHQDFASLLTTDNCTPVEEGEYAAYSGSGIINVEKLLDAVGYAGMYTTSENGSLRVRGAYHPKPSDRPGGEADFVMVVGAYNAQGHLLFSRIGMTEKSLYNGYSATAVLNGLSDVAKLRVFFLKGDGTLSAPVDAVTYTVVQE